MCGFVGIFGQFEDRLTTGALSRSMLGALVHRGPDEWGSYVSAECSFAHARLSIIDVRDGQQPMSDGRYVIAYNGEVYNYIELRRELLAEGCVFTTHSDTEVILKAFAAWGQKAFSRFNGQFAALIWDKKERTLTAFRDRYGIRPLFMLPFRGCWFFASETKAFDVIPGYTRRFSPQHLFEHGLLWNTLGTDTVFEDILTVPAATSMSLRPGDEPSFHRYYTLGETNQPAPKNFEQAKEELSELLSDSVRLRLRSDVPVGAYLSGGIDSSVITHLTARYNKEAFKTFSIGFSDSDFDESCYQAEMVESIGSEHSPITIGYDDVDTNFMQAVYHCERPLFRTAPIPLYLLSQTVRDHGMKVVLTGEASDEILFGYDSYKELKLLQFWSRFPQSQLRPQLIKRLYPHLHHYADSQQYGLMRMYYEGFLDSFKNGLASLNIRVANNRVLENYFNKDLGVAYNQEALLEKVGNTMPSGQKNWTLLQRNQYLEMQTLLDGYLLSSQGDRMSLAHGVEGRYPFLDHRLIERAFSYPDSYKLSGFSQKHILRKTFMGRIPDSIVDRPKLPYQAPDLRAFIRDGRYTATVEEFMSPQSIEEYGLFDPKMVSRFLKKHQLRMRDQVGYRDNMLITFMLSAQICNHWIKNPKSHLLNPNKQVVNFTDQ